MNTFNNDTDKLISSKINDFNQTCEEFSNKALFAATLCSRFEFVQEAYKEYYNSNDIESASKIIESHTDKLNTLIKTNTGFDARIHYHLPPARSFIRCWSEKRGDDISAFRSTVLQVSKTHKAVKGIETGRGGFVIRGISPIVSDDNEFLGTVEVFFDINQVVEQITSNEDEEFSVFMKTDLLPLASKFLEDSASNILMDQRVIGDFIFVEKTDGFLLSNLSQEALNGVSNELSVFKNGIHKYAVIPIRNFSGVTEGIGILQVDISGYISDLRSIIFIIVVTAFVMLIILLSINTRSIARTTKRIIRLDNSLKILAKGNPVEKTDVTINDEIGQMEQSLNTLNDLISKNTDFALNLGKGNFDHKYEPLGEEDMLGNALVKMKNSLKDKNKQLTESEERFRELASLTFEGIIVHQDGVLIDANQAFLRMIGFTKEQLLGKNIIAMVIPQRYHQFLAEQRTMDYVKPYEIEAVRKDGVVVPIEIESQNINYQGVIRRVSAIRDITDRKKSEAEIQKLSFAIDQAFVAVTITDKDGNIEYVNPYYCELTGYNFDEVKGKTLYSIEFNSKLPDEHERLLAIIASGKSWEGEFNNKKKGGEEYTERAIITPVKDESGNITNLIAVRMDVTRQKEIEKALLEAKVKAEESDRLKSAFLANMSHEIRTPMNSIIGFSEMLDMPDVEEESRKEFLEIIKSNGYRLLSLINDIIDISKIEAGQIELRMVKTNVNDLLSKLYEVFRFSASKKGIDFRLMTGLENDLSVISADNTKLNQILTNLINNAVKFTHKGEIQFGYELKTGMLEFFINDTGIGINQEHQDKIFERFRQVEISVTKQYEGTGLGLAISKALVEKMGGKIWVVSKPGSGSTFYFTIPYKPEIIIDTSPKPKIKSKVDLKERTILIAEDEYSNYLLLKEVLKDTGAELIHVENGMDAIEKCRENPQIDLILMDIKMPEMDGYQATEAIKKIRPGILILAQTAYAMFDDERKAFRAGCDDFITKPLTKQAVLSKISKLMNSKKR
jgi:PAS domain S-box-containing protein